MHITLIGMSNIGKSHLAKRLEAELGYARIDCDPMVAEKIGLQLTGIADVAAWMGQPGADNPAYDERSDVFVQCERAVMLDVLEAFSVPQTKPRVVDTCGSVIYTGGDVLERLRATTRVVYLEANEEYRAELFARYIKQPKPLVWRDGAFSQSAGQGKHDALAEGYPRLLATRDRHYRDLAHDIIPFDMHRNRQADLRKMLGL